MANKLNEITPGKVRLVLDGGVETIYERADPIEAAETALLKLGTIAQRVGNPIYFTANVASLWEEGEKDFYVTPAGHVFPTSVPYDAATQTPQVDEKAASTTPPPPPPPEQQPRVPHEPSPSATDTATTIAPATSNTPDTTNTTITPVTTDRASVEPQHQPALQHTPPPATAPVDTPQTRHQPTPPAPPAPTENAHTPRRVPWRLIGLIAAAALAVTAVVFGVYYYTHPRNPAPTSKPTTVKTTTSTPRASLHVSAAGNTICFTNPNGIGVTCQGNNEKAQTGAPTPSEHEHQVIDDLKSTPIRVLASSPSNTCALTTDNAVWCWGTGIISPDPTEPTRIKGLDDAKGLTYLAVGAAHACVANTHTVWCFGDNTYGQTTHGDTQDAAPIKGLPDQPITGLTTDGYATIALTKDTAWAWGANAWGQITPNGPTATGPIQIK